MSPSHDKQTQNTVRPQYRKQSKTHYYTEKNAMYNLQASHELFRIAPISTDICNINVTWIGEHCRKSRLLH